jgi:general secretion pathway protein G
MPELTATTPYRRERRGFTLIELLVVLAIVALLLALALPRYFQGIDRSRETVLRENLRLVRSTIDAFYGDTGRYPESLGELVDKHYLRGLPLDPVTGRTDSWVIVAPADGSAGQVYDIKSSATGADSDGQPYSAL